jgi:hypothetical protein
MFNLIESKKLELGVAGQILVTLVDFDLAKLITYIIITYYRTSMHRRSNTAAPWQLALTTASGEVNLNLNVSVSTWVGFISCK